MFVNFSEEVRHILKLAEKERNFLNHPYVGSEHLFLAVLKEGTLVDVFKKNNLTYDKFKNKLINLVGIGSKKSDFNLYTPLLKRVLENSVIEAKEENLKNVTPEIIILSIMDEENGVAYSILNTLNINIDKLYNDLRRKKINKPFKKRKLLLDEIGLDLTKEAKEKKLDPVIGRNLEIEKTIEILLRRKKNNPILIGPAGVGKTAIVEEIANMIANGKCNSFLKNKRIISLNIFSLVSGTKYRGEFEEKMKNLIKELEENDDIILFIDEAHTIVGAGGAEGAIDASNIFKPALARGKIKIIGATTIDEYKKYIEPDAALSRRFQSVFINEPSIKDVIKILTNIKPLYEKHHNVTISDNLVKEIVTLSDKYLVNRFEPDRSIDVLDEVCARASNKESTLDKKRKKILLKLDKLKKLKKDVLLNNDFKKAYSIKENENILLDKLKSIKNVKKSVTISDIYDVIKNKGNILLSNDDSYYNKLQKDLKNILINQDNNIDKIVKHLRKRELTYKKHPFSLLIKGKEGSGKTILSNELLKKVIGEKNIIKIDLSTYKEYHMISKLIGTTAGYLGYDNKNNVFEKIRLNPSMGLIIDNFYDACIEVQNIFYDILKNGFIEDATGKKIDFTNTIIIFNKKEENKEKVGFNSKSAKEEKDDLEEFVSLKISMNELKDNDIIKLIDKKTKTLLTKYNKINVNISSDYYNLILNNLNKNIKQIDRVIGDKIENKIVDALLENKKHINITV